MEIIQYQGNQIQINQIAYEAPFLDPIQFIKEEAYREKEKQLNIATEIFLAENYAKIHYADLMDNIPQNMASKSMLLSWLNDYNRQEKVLRPGLITLYLRQRSDHFNNGRWMAYRVCEFVKFVILNISDLDFIKDKKKVKKFKDSIMDHDWFMKAVAVMGLKLMDKLNSQKKLSSRLAAVILDESKLIRDTLEKQGGIIGRAAKNGVIDNTCLTELRETSGDLIKALWQSQLERAKQHEEYRIFEQYKHYLAESILMLHGNICKQIGN